MYSTIQAVMIWFKDHRPDAIKGCMEATLQAPPLTMGSIKGPKKGEKATPLQIATQQRKIVFGHECVIMGFDGSNLTLFNPWNRSTEKDDRRGQFTMPFGDYLKYFQTITSEAAPQ